MASSPWIVLKFGGTSVASAERWAQIAERVRARQASHRVWVVVSALAGTSNALERAVADGSDIEARSMMMAASLMGATAFQKGLGGIHAMSHPVGARLHSHHGTTNAVFMPYVLVRNREAIGEAMVQLAAARAGLGLAMIPCFMGDPDPRLVRVVDELARPAHELWILTHPDLRDTSRIRAFMRHIADAFADKRALLAGELGNSD